jgi:AraC family transcriptional regulator of adaptative response/methylated-DNA-[protein]-cysteine methyltransferase
MLVTAHTPLSARQRPSSAEVSRESRRVVRAAVARCALGHALVVASSRGVCAVSLGDTKDDVLADLSARFADATVREADPAHAAITAQVLAALEGTSSVAPPVRLDLSGTVFQLKVWGALQGIARGETVTYAELARRIGAPAAVRAVGTACGQNPVAVLVPCHRVLRANGELGGYRWGLARKRRLLARERQSP